MAYSNKKLVPEAMNALDKFKYEVASDVGVKIIFKHHITCNFIFFLKHINLLFYFLHSQFYTVAFYFLLLNLYLLIL